MSFNKVADLRPAALLKGDSSKDVYPWILRDFLEHLFCIAYEYRILYKMGVLKSLAKFTAKFMWTTASGISGNRSCWKLTVSQYLRPLSLSTEMRFSTDLALMTTQSTY